MKGIFGEERQKDMGNLSWEIISSMKVPCIKGKLMVMGGISKEICYLKANS